MSRRDALVLRAFATWTAYVWVTRLWNIWRDTARDTPFKVVHTLLAVVSVAFAAATWAIVRRNRAGAAAG
jgi:hypothetical protein